LAGELLKKRREDLGLSVQEAAETLKIRADYLSGIESDSFDKLPVPVYTVGYIRAYAKYLNIDSEPIVLYYSEHLAQPKTAAIMPVGFSRRRSPLLYSIIGAISVLLVLCVLFVVYYSSGKGAGSKTAVSPAKAPAEQQAQTRGVLHQAPSRAAPQKEAPPARKHDLDISAEEATWLSIKFNDGKREEVLLRPGDSRSWKFSKTAILRIGNAGGVRITFDGADMGTPGSTGEVVTMTLPGGKERSPTSP
jgi:cytoskeletal protein RodZ